MMYRAMIGKARAWIEEMASEYGLSDDLNTMWSAYLDYAMMSVRVSGLNGKADFKLASIKDTPDDVRAKFEAYMQTKTPAIVWDIEQQIEAMDAPANPDNAPDFDSDDPNV
jgi:hypothetical protein